MWIERSDKKSLFIKDLLELNGQVLIVQGARQVGKTSFVLNALEDLKEYAQLKLNLLYPSSFVLNGTQYLGRDFFGKSPSGEDFLKNIEMEIGGVKELKKPAFIFVDEVDRHPQALEAIQSLAEFSDMLKFVFTGSNLENIPVKNAATGRKKFFDLYPITFMEFLGAGENAKLLAYLDQQSVKNNSHSDHYHNQLKEQFNYYLRLGGMPKIVDAFLDIAHAKQAIPEIVKDLAVSIEENVKTVLGERSKLYEYEDILRKIAFLSMNTLKFSNLQVQHAGRSEAKKLVAKTVGARVSHKIRLFESEKDLSKYIIFDCGIANYLLCGSDLLKSTPGDKNLAVLCETFVGTELIANLVTRDDLFYWKSGNRAEIEYILRAPYFVGIDVKTKKGDNKSLNSLALFEPDVSFLVKICDAPLQVDLNYVASLPNFEGQRKIPLVTVPHYLSSRLFDILREVASF